MSRQKLTQQVMGAMLITLLLVGCGAPATTPTPVSPTATPTQTFTLITSTEDIVGTWHAGNYYIRFDKDGTFRQAHALDKLDSQPYTIISYQFEGTKMVITEVSVSGVPTCGIKTGSYEIRLLESGSIRIEAIKDECTQRRNDISKEYEPVR
jgi:hypothetical protein